MNNGAKVEKNQKVDVTPEMVKAAQAVWYNDGLSDLLDFDLPDEMAEAIFLAMLEVRNGQPRNKKRGVEAINPNWGIPFIKDENSSTVEIAFVEQQAFIQLERDGKTAVIDLADGKLDFRGNMEITEAAKQFFHSWAVLVAQHRLYGHDWTYGNAEQNSFSAE